MGSTFSEVVVRGDTNHSVVIKSKKMKIKHVAFWAFIFVTSMEGSIAQDFPKSVEQQALSYFMDSIFNLNYKHVKQVCYFEGIINEESMLKSPIGFTDYHNPIDSAERNQVRQIQREFESLNLSSVKLLLGETKSLFVKPISIKKRKCVTGKSVSLQVFKRNIFRVGKYIVEIKVANREMRTHFFLEISSVNLTVLRWYKAEYFF